MKLLRGLAPYAVLEQGTAATMGNFDGVHLGHQALLSALRSQADSLGLPLLVMVFEPQPGEYFKAQSAPARLTTLREKLQLFRQCGVDYVYCLRFDKKLAAMPAEVFARRVIFPLLNAKYLLVGEDFRFGQGRTGDIALLQAESARAACELNSFPDFFIARERVSSTRIRQYLQQQDLNAAKHCLGRPYHLCGRVVMGNQRARQWGTPTANVHLKRLVAPLNGVYCVRVLRENKQILNGVANIGCRPTLDGQKTVLEVHLFDFNESLYGELLQVFFLHPLRQEIKFSSVDALVTQIKQDIATAKDWFVGCHSLLM
jgi:riboflavin kinase/FMN adenylyltransferase